jgi:hypothetical protein
MTMIRPKIKGLPMTKPKKSKGKQDFDGIGIKAKGNMKGEFLGTKGMMR